MIADTYYLLFDEYLSQILALVKWLTKELVGQTATLISNLFRLGLSHGMSPFRSGLHSSKKVSNPQVNYFLLAVVLSLPFLSLPFLVSFASC